LVSLRRGGLLTLFSILSSAFTFFWFLCCGVLWCRPTDRLGLAQSPQDTGWTRLLFLASGFWLLGPAPVISLFPISFFFLLPLSPPFLVSFLPVIPFSNSSLFSCTGTGTRTHNSSGACANNKSVYEKGSGCFLHVPGIM
jgi:hypothetical protein